MKRKNYALFASVLIFILAWITLLQFLSPTEIVMRIGIHNVYLAAFILAIIVGGSSFTAGALYVVLISFIHGGASLWALALIAGAGAMVGDTLYYFLGHSSHSIVSTKLQKKLRKVSKILQRHPRLTPLFVFLYAAFMPMPNDIMTISLGLSDYPYKNMILPLLIGNIIYFVWVLSTGMSLYALLS